MIIELTIFQLLQFSDDRVTFLMTLEIIICVAGFS